MLYKRKIIDELLNLLSTPEIIVLHGSRQVGKTSIMLWLGDYLKEKAQVFFIDLEDLRFLEILNQGPQGLLQLLMERGYKDSQKTYVFIDEIQYLNNPSNFLKLIADHHNNLKLIVSGSSSFNIKKKFSDSLAGRTLEFEVFNLSFEEFLTFKNSPLDSKRARTSLAEDELKSYFQEYVLYGGYPRIVLAADIGLKEKYLAQIIDTYVRKDVRDLAGIRNPEKFNRLLEVLASQSSQLLNITELADTVGLAKQTISEYLFLLEQTYIIRLLRPFSRNKRTELFKTPKVFFLDTGLMQMLWLKGLQKEVLGQVFETGIFAELAKKYGAARLNYWRAISKQEIDFVVRQGKEIMPVEAKLNFAQIQNQTMKYFCEKYNIQKYFFIGLKGSPKNEHEIYPWQI